MLLKHNFSLLYITRLLTYNSQPITHNPDDSHCEATRAFGVDSNLIPLAISKKTCPTTASEVSNLANVQCLSNSKIYHKYPQLSSEKLDKSKFL